MCLLQRLALLRLFSDVLNGTNQSNRPIAFAHRCALRPHPYALVVGADKRQFEVPAFTGFYRMANGIRDDRSGLRCIEPDCIACDWAVTGHKPMDDAGLVGPAQFLGSNVEFPSTNIRKHTGLRQQLLAAAQCCLLLLTMMGANAVKPVVKQCHHHLCKFSQRTLLFLIKRPWHSINYTQSTNHGTIAQAQWMTGIEAEFLLLTGY